MFFLIRFPFFQTWIAQKVAAYLSKEWNTEVRIGSLSITGSYILQLEDVMVKDQKKDTLVCASKIYCHLLDFNFSQNRYWIDELTLQDATLKIIQYEGDSVLNFQFIADYFASDKIDTTASKPLSMSLSRLNLYNVTLVREDQNVKKDSTGVIDFNHLRFSDLYLNLANLNIRGDTITTLLNHFSFAEQSGFRVLEFAGGIAFTPKSIELQTVLLRTNYTALYFSNSFLFDSISDFGDFFNKIKLKAKFHSGYFNMADLAFFVPSMKGINQKISILGNIQGKLSDIKANNLFLGIGNLAYLKGNLQMTGLPNFDETFIYANLQDFSTSVDKLAQLRIPPYDNENYLQLPAVAKRLGNVNFRGKFSGFLNDFVANGEFNTSLGSLSTDLKMANDERSKTIVYSGKIKAKSFRLGQLLSNSDLGLVSLNLDVQGKGLDLKKINVKAKGEIADFDFKKYKYKRIELDGKFNEMNFDGTVGIKDENIDLFLQGNVDLSSEIPVFKFKSEIKHLELVKLGLLPSDSISDAEFAVRINADLRGKHLDNLEGIVKIEKLKYCQMGHSFDINNFVLTTLSNKERVIKIESDFLDANISGDINFAQLPLLFQNWLSQYIGGIVKPDKSKELADARFQYSFLFKRINPILETFFPRVYIKDGSFIKGEFDNVANKFRLQLSLPEFSYATTHAKGLKINSETVANGLDLSVNSDYLILNDSSMFETIKLKCHARNDSTDFNLHWESNVGLSNTASISGVIYTANYPRLALGLKKSEISINDTVWSFTPGALITLDSNYYSINNLVLSNRGQYMKVNGTVSRNPADEIKLEFKDFDLANANIFTKTAGITFGGKLSGNVKAGDLFGNIDVGSDLVLNNFTFNGNPIGNANIRSGWDYLNKALDVYACFINKWDTTLLLTGYIYPERKKDNLNMDLMVRNLNYNIFRKWLSGFLTDFNEGKLAGRMKLRGELNDPDLSGKLMMRRVGFRVIYTNVRYVTNTTIAFDKNSIIFENFEVQDTVGNIATINGRIKHHQFSDLQLDLGIKAKKFSCLNTTKKQNNLYYGSAILSGDIKITGTPDKVKIDISPCVTEKGTQFFLPLEGTTEVAENKVVRFVNKKDTISIVKKRRDENVDLSGVELNFDLQVTPDAEVQIILDEKIGDIIKARGNGDLKFIINSQGDFKMFNDFVIEDGDYLFTLQNVINKKFKIEKGSYVKWNGDPYNADLNINAVYPLKAAIADLGLMTDTSRRKVPVECIISMKNSLLAPDIKFDINFPGMDEMMKERIRSEIESSINMQMLSLLVTRRFAKVSGSMDQGGTGNAVGSNASELLSNQLSNWLSQISNKVDIGVNYRAGDKLSKDELEFVFSTQLFNDRVSINSSFDVTGGQQRSTSNIVGDVEIEYKVTEEGKLRIKAFNRTNDSYDLLNEARTKQGIGVFYRKEFDSFKDIFKSSKKKKKEKNND